MSNSVQEQTLATVGSPASRRSRIHRAIVCAAPVSLPARYAVYFKPGRRQ